MAEISTEVLIVGTGLAGLSSALYLSKDFDVTLVSKRSIRTGNSPWAQGGIAAAVSSSDSVENHIQDTLVAGAGLCNQEAVADFIRQAPDRISDLQKWGVKFDYHGSEPDLTKEGAHSDRRIFHVKDHTGEAIHNHLCDLVLKNPKIKVLENHFLIDLITNKSIKDFHTGPTECFGGYFLNSKSGEVTALNARVTILATGGAGKTYLYTSNWEGATGDGVAAAHRAGARIANMEFTQFHPTCLYHKDERSFLISEALRGEGGVLVNKSGFPFMTKYHELKDLAPRDIVARSIDHELKSSGDECVYLDMKALSPKEIQEKFPAIFQKCLSLGIDISKDKIPVVPAAHYMCGGVLSTVNGETDILRLHAIGEVACNGFHGANRLASNSLLECLASAYNSARAVREKWEGSLSKHKFAPRPWVYTQKSNTDELAVINHIWDEIRRLMWNYVGIVRSNKRLDRAQSRLKNILSEITEYYWDFTLTSDILELRNIATVANLTVECALKRKESRGIHFNLDYPNTLETEALPTILSFKS